MDLANDLKSFLVTLLLFVAISASAQTQGQVKNPDEMTRSEVVVNIVSWEAVIANYDTYHNLLSQFPDCLLYTSPSPRDKRQSRMPSSA